MLLLAAGASAEELAAGDEHRQQQPCDQDVEAAGHVVQRERLLSALLRVRVLALGPVVPPLVLQAGQLACRAGGGGR